MLCFNGGCINAGGFLATGRFVSHVTGFATLFGVDMMRYQLEAAAGILSVPLFFLLGAFIAGLLIDRPIYKGKHPHFDWVMLLCAICLFLAASGDFLQFGSFGEELKLKQKYILLALLCLTSGLQNAAITSSSGSSIRTTHLTGLTTDLGLGLARILTFNLQKGKMPIEVQAAKLRAGSILSFIFGSAIGAGIFLKYGYLGFLPSAFISLYSAWRGKREKIVAHRGATTIT
jgi:uncharacterized membrane protein YoaK (UPF0700 family)